MDAVKGYVEGLPEAMRTALWPLILAAVEEASGWKAAAAMQVSAGEPAESKRPMLELSRCLEETKLSKARRGQILHLAAEALRLQEEETTRACVPAVVGESLELLGKYIYRAGYHEGIRDVASEFQRFGTDVERGAAEAVRVLREELHTIRPWELTRRALTAEADAAKALSEEYRVPGRPFGPHPMAALAAKVGGRDFGQSSQVADTAVLAAVLAALSVRDEDFWCKAICTPGFRLLDIEEGEEPCVWFTMNAAPKGGIAILLTSRSVISSWERLDRVGLRPAVGSRGWRTGDNPLPHPLPETLKALISWAALGVEKILAAEEHHARALAAYGYPSSPPVWVCGGIVGTSEGPSLPEALAVRSLGLALDEHMQIIYPSLLRIP